MLAGNVEIPHNAVDLDFPVGRMGRLGLMNIQNIVLIKPYILKTAAVVMVSIWLSDRRFMRCLLSD